jgi:HD superfamily phosphodiesterase
LTRDQILNQIRAQCTQEYLQIDNWIHDLTHIKKVVANGKKICQREDIKPKTAFLVEIACWLHDLGRVGEGIGLLASQSNHAEVSYQKSKIILKPYERFLGRESVYLILEAVREHSLPQIKHPNNLVARILMDSDRGAGLNAIGIFTMLNYYKIIKSPPIVTKKQARLQLPDLTQQLIANHQLELAINYLSFFHSWYYGSNNQSLTGVKVGALFTPAAKKLFRHGMKEIESYIKVLESYLALKQKGDYYPLV